MFARVASTQVRAGSRAYAVGIFMTTMLRSAGVRSRPWLQEGKSVRFKAQKKQIVTIEFVL